MTTETDKTVVDPDTTPAPKITTCRDSTPQRLPLMKLNSKLQRTPAPPRGVLRSTSLIYTTDPPLHAKTALLYARVSLRLREAPTPRNYSKPVGVHFVFMRTWYTYMLIQDADKNCDQNTRGTAHGTRQPNRTEPSLAVAADVGRVPLQRALPALLQVLARGGGRGSGGAHNTGSEIGAGRKGGGVDIGNRVQPFESPARGFSGGNVGRGDFPASAGGRVFETRS